MEGLAIKEIRTEQELKAALELCYRILGEDNSELYGYDAWSGRLANGEPMVYGEKDGIVVSAGSLRRKYQILPKYSIRKISCQCSVAFFFEFQA